MSKSIFHIHEDNWRIKECTSIETPIDKYYDCISYKFDDLYEAKNDFSKKKWKDKCSIFSRFREHLQKKPYEKIIDIGCGTANWSRIFLNSAKLITLIDVSDSMLSIAAKRMISERRDININIIKMDINDSSIKPVEEKYDLAIIGFLLTHYEDEEIDSILNKVKSISNRIIVIDSVGGNNDLPKDKMLTKEHLIDNKWVGVKKIYPSINSWKDIFSRNHFILNESIFNTDFALFDLS
ncbi:TPA: class I SAM-dependent methyltransferase [Vibrio parahaemolyticus]|nr:class I SAM-dependent methyltransferase [Vibrio parahaemolyticus]MDF4714182.1 class I SAM-dependent methyltransferase [Vibrio parahaemolyticus]HCG6608785.1 class I SAM-dependent methyltransferase [Vibrio parahaemolyticus]